jgi:2-iminobutanoate/2-iminopropanoate deaminase
MNTDVAVNTIDLEFDRFEEIAISQGFRVGDLLFVSGQAATADDHSVVGVGDFVAQGEQAFANLSRVLEAGGSALENVVKVTIFVTDMAANYADVVALRRRYFQAPYPADTIVEVTAMARPDLMIEIEAIAVALPGR